MELGLLIYKMSTQEDTNLNLYECNISSLLINLDCMYSCLMLFIETPTFFARYLRFLVAQRVQNLPAIQETWVRSLGQEDPMEKGMATHSSILS